MRFKEENEIITKKEEMVQNEWDKLKWKEVQIKRNKESIIIIIKPFKARMEQVFSLFGFLNCFVICLIHNK